MGKTRFLTIRRGLRIISAVLCLGMLVLCLPVRVAYAAQEPELAENIGEVSRVTQQTGIGNCHALFDGSVTNFTTLQPGASLTVEYEGGISAAYLIFNGEYGPYTVTDDRTGAQATFGEEGYLHSFADLEGAFGHAPLSVTISFGDGPTKLNELSLFTPGELPEFVQRWEAPKDAKTDLILFSTHGDDEQLFFSGLLPTYAGERGYAVQVVYLTDHHNTNAMRRHEMLDGLWAVGVKTYPVFGTFGDYFCRSAKQAYDLHRYMGEDEDALLGFVVEQLRRFQPLVAVGHDLGGEYGHGQHMMYADLLCRSLEIANDPQQFPESAEKWGTWDVPKTYLHLWPEATIRMDWDKPLESFGGMTAFQVSKERGFACHKSQKADFAWYAGSYERAADIPSYNPCEYGLYRTTVGNDIQKEDFFEHITPRKIP